MDAIHVHEPAVVDGPAPRYYSHGEFIHVKHAYLLEQFHIYETRYRRRSRLGMSRDRQNPQLTGSSSLTPLTRLTKESSPFSPRVEEASRASQRPCWPRASRCP